VGKQFIFDQLKTLPIPQLKVICRGVSETEKAFGWDHTVMRQFMEDRSLWYEEVNR